MNASRFLDTNILLYAYDLRAGQKRDRAKSIVREGWQFIGQTALSVHVLQELHVNLTRLGRSVSESAEIVQDFSCWPVVENTVDILRSAIDIQIRFGISFWDSLIVAAAAASGAREVLSEDLNDGQVYSGVKVVNPFKPRV